MALMVGVYLLRMASENLTDQVPEAAWPKEELRVTNKNTKLMVKLFMWFGLLELTRQIFIKYS